MHHLMHDLMLIILVFFFFCFLVEFSCFFLVSKSTHFYLLTLGLHSSGLALGLLLAFMTLNFDLLRRCKCGNKWYFSLQCLFESIWGFLFFTFWFPSLVHGESQSDLTDLLLCFFSCFSVRYLIWSLLLLLQVFYSFSFYLYFFFLMWSLSSLVSFYWWTWLILVDLFWSLCLSFRNSILGNWFNWLW